MRRGEGLGVAEMECCASVHHGRASWRILLPMLPASISQASPGRRTEQGTSRDGSVRARDCMQHLNEWQAGQRRRGRVADDDASCRILNPALDKK